MTNNEKPFDRNDWQKRFDRNSDEAERNSMMDSGWSAMTAENCMRVACGLWRELAVAIAATETKPLDFFERCELIDVQEAARYATSPKAEKVTL